MEPKVAIIITTYNQDKLAQICINSIKNKTNYKNYKIFFIDDSGKGKIAKNFSKKFKWIKVIENKKNLGFSKSNNVGIREAKKTFNPDYFLLLNDDCEIIDKNWLKKLIKIGQNDKEIGILGAKIIYPDETLQNIGGYLKGWEIVKELSDKRKKPFEVDHVMGAFLLFKKEVSNKIGLLSELYTPYLLEDTDFCLLAKKNGFKVISVPKVEVIHKKGKTIDLRPSKKRMFIRFKNDMIFSIRNLSIKNRLFRIFVFLPMVAIFRKKKDEDSLKFKNFKLRKDFLLNLFLLLLAFFYNIKNIGRLKCKEN